MRPLPRTPALPPVGPCPQAVDPGRGYSQGGGVIPPFPSPLQAQVGAWAGGRARLASPSPLSLRGPGTGHLHPLLAFPGLMAAALRLAKTRPAEGGRSSGPRPRLSAHAPPPPRAAGSQLVWNLVFALPPPPSQPPAQGLAPSRAAGEPGGYGQTTSKSWTPEHPMGPHRWRKVRWLFFFPVFFLGCSMAHELL